MKDYLDKDIVAGDEVVIATGRGFRRAKIRSIGHMSVKIFFLESPTRILDFPPFKLIKI